MRAGTDARSISSSERDHTVPAQARFQGDDRAGPHGINTRDPIPRFELTTRLVLRTKVSDQRRMNDYPNVWVDRPTLHVGSGSLSI